MEWPELMDRTVYMIFKFVIAQKEVHRSAYLDEKEILYSKSKIPFNVVIEHTTFEFDNYEVKVVKKLKTQLKKLNKTCWYDNKADYPIYPRYRNPYFEAVCVANGLDVSLQIFLGNLWLLKTGYLDVGDEDGRIREVSKQCTFLADVNGTDTKGLAKSGTALQKYNDFNVVILILRVSIAVLMFY